jgi:hypothetical protein
VWQAHSVSTCRMIVTTCFAMRFASTNPKLLLRRLLQHDTGTKSTDQDTLSGNTLTESQINADEM